jgi:tripartite-type tricarboxylate transporter receptor subunit TctC
MDPATLTKFLTDELRRWQKLVQEAGLVEK